MDDQRLRLLREEMCRAVGGELTAEGYIHTALGTWETLLVEGELMVRAVDRAAQRSCEQWEGDR